jgi:predicted RND superfamily exporter protein
MIDRIFGRLAEIINHHPRRVAIVLGIVFIIALYGVTLITMETGNDTYLDKNSPEGILNNHYADTFSSNALILIVETSDPLSPQVNSYIDELEQDINQQENVEGSASVADLLKSANGGVLPQSKGEIDTIVARIPPDVKSTAVPSNVLTLVQITLSQGLSEKAKSATLKNVEALIDHSSPPPGVRYRFLVVQHSPNR